MATTFEEVFEITLAFIDEMQPNGTISGDTREEYEQKSLRMVTSLQNELMKDGDLYSTYEISRTTILPLVSNTNVFEHNTEDITVESSEIARAYYFEINSPATVYIEDYNGVWNTLETIIVPSTVTSYTAYKGLTTPSVGASKTRIRFSGTTYYNYQNYALYKQSFASADRIPDFRPWVKYEMPDDFKSVERIIKEYFPAQYVRDADYKWEGRKDLYLCYEFTGNVRVIYKPVPLTITANTDTLQIDDITATTVLPNGLAAVILSSENPDLANYFQSRYDELKGELTQKPPVAENTVDNVYGGGDC